MRLLILLTTILLAETITAFGQKKSYEINKHDTIIFVNYNAKDLSDLKKQRLTEALQENRISPGLWDFEQCSLMGKYFERELEKIIKKLKKKNINYRFISAKDTLSASENNLMLTTDFTIREDKKKYLITFTISKLSDKDGNLIIDGGALGIVKELKLKE